MDWRSKRIRPRSAAIGPPASGPEERGQEDHAAHLAVVASVAIQDHILTWVVMEEFGCHYTVDNGVLGDQRQYIGSNFINFAEGGGGG